MQRKGEIGPLMWLIIGIMVLLAVIMVVIVLKNRSLNILGGIKDSL